MRRIFKGYADKKPSYVWYADKPPLLGGVPRKISIAEFMMIYTDHGGKAFEYTEALWIETEELPFPPAPPYTGKWAAYEIPASNLLIQGPQIDKFVIAPTGELGMGVFASRDIACLEPLAIYTGVVKAKVSRYSPYAFNLASDYSVDATKYGNISRFFQHVPNDFSKWLEGEHERKESEYQQIARTQGDAAVQEARRVAEFKLKETIIVDDFEWHLHMMQYKPELGVLLATSNVISNEIYLDIVPVKLMSAARPIKKGHMLGLSYGKDYFNEENPKLFYYNGAVVPENEYKYLMCPVFFNKNTEIFVRQTVWHYRSNIDKQKPVYFEKFNKWLSFFYIRDRLVKNNVLSNVHAKIEPNVCAVHLQELIQPYNIFVKCYYHNPESKISVRQYTVDIVCQALSVYMAEAFWQLIQKTKNTKYCVYNPEVNEIVIRSVNVRDKEMAEFIVKLQRPENLAQLAVAKVNADKAIAAKYNP